MICVFFQLFYCTPFFFIFSDFSLCTLSTAPMYYHVLREMSEPFPPAAWRPASNPLWHSKSGRLHHLISNDTAHLYIEAVHHPLQREWYPISTDQCQFLNAKITCQCCTLRMTQCLLSGNASLLHHLIQMHTKIVVNPITKRRKSVRLSNQELIFCKRRRRFLYDERSYKTIP